MSVKIDIRSVEKAIDNELTPAQATKIQNAAINTGAEKVANNLRTAFLKFKGTEYSTGATANEVTASKAKRTSDGRRAEIGWNGPKQRFRIIHLNEWGYTKKGKRHKPRMMGTVQNTIDKSNGEYFEIVGRVLQDGYTKHK